MALLNVLLSGAWRVSVAGGESAAKGFSALSPLTAALGSLSVYLQQDIILATTASEFLFSQLAFSNPQLILMTATNPVRVNFGGQASSVSAASASVVTFKDAFLLMNISGVLPSSIHLGNSGSDSSTVTLLIAG
jgi:hypothetical protein